jgi:hypothetical protein
VGTAGALVLDEVYMIVTEIEVEPDLDANIVIDNIGSANRDLIVDIRPDPLVPRLPQPGRRDRQEGLPRLAPTSLSASARLSPQAHVRPDDHRIPRMRRR